LIVFIALVIALIALTVATEALVSVNKFALIVIERYYCLNACSELVLTEALLWFPLALEAATLVHHYYRYHFLQLQSCRYEVTYS
jgi:hypothetical protein